jgi:hypothetical protein
LGVRMFLNDLNNGTVWLDRFEIFEPYVGPVSTYRGLIMKMYAKFLIPPHMTSEGSGMDDGKEQSRRSYVGNTRNVEIRAAPPRWAPRAVCRRHAPEGGAKRPHPYGAHFFQVWLCAENALRKTRLEDRGVSLAQLAAGKLGWRSPKPCDSPGH